MARRAPRREDVLGEYADEVLALFPRGRILVGIDGLDGAGKTTFARDLVAALVERGVDAASVSMDDFRSRVSPADGRSWYREVYDLDAFRADVALPYRRGDAVRAAVRPVPVDGRKDAAWRPADRAVLVVEGLYLHRPELVGLWHTSVWLSTDVETGIARCEVRDGNLPTWSADVPQRIREASEIYLREAGPPRRANATFDLHDPEHPRPVFSDAC